MKYLKVNWSGVKALTGIFLFIYIIQIPLIYFYEPTSADFENFVIEVGDVTFVGGIDSDKTYFNRVPMFCSSNHLWGGSACDRKFVGKQTVKFVFLKSLFKINKVAAYFNDEVPNEKIIERKKKNWRFNAFFRAYVTATIVFMLHLLITSIFVRKNHG
jgi:hypothetical protein